MLRRNKINSRVSRFESLETRNLLAGNVSAFVDGGGDLVIQGAGSTFLDIETGDGNDVVTIANVTVIDAATVNTHDGTDAVAISKMTSGQINVSLEGGNYDTLAISNSTAEDANFDGGGNTGDTLVMAHNRFELENHANFQYVIG